MFDSSLNWLCPSLIIFLVPMWFILIIFVRSIKRLIYAIDSIVITMKSFKLLLDSLNDKMIQNKDQLYKKL